MNINPVWEYIKVKANKKIENEETASYYAQRKIDVETVFGNIKQNMNFRRFHVRGSKKFLRKWDLYFLRTILGN
ncbi:transposase [Enterococcus cecorum]|uniref:transposase n=1 Tax=Enterococcus cecorum TaxID=44008 RepID=UPI003D100444